MDVEHPATGIGLGRIMKHLPGDYDIDKDCSRSVSPGHRRLGRAQGNWVENRLSNAVILFDRGESEAEVCRLAYSES